MQIFLIACIWVFFHGIALAGEQDITDIKAMKAWPEINFEFNKTTREDVVNYHLNNGSQLSNNKTPLGNMLVAKVKNDVSGYTFSNGKLFAVHNYYPAKAYDIFLLDISKTLGPSVDYFNPIIKRHVRAWVFPKTVITLGPTDNPEVVVLTHTLSSVFD